VTITAPSNFRRSSERKVGEAELRAWAFADAAEDDRRRDEFESLACGFTGLGRRSLTIHDETRFDLDGVTYP
jgi:hypothetical protein